jgi:hypothetical protein
VAEARLEIAGEAVPDADGGVVVRVGLANRGSMPALKPRLEGELLGQRQAGSLDGPIPPGETRSLPLQFDLDEAGPGVHAVALRLEYQSSRSPGAPLRTLLQPAFLLVALGENAPPAVRIHAPQALMDSVGRWRVGLESLDGAAHRVRLRAVLPRNLRVTPDEALVEVPPRGRVERELLLFRVDAPWESDQGAVLLAATEGESLVRTSAATAVVRVGPEPARLPRLRPALVAVMILLLAAAAALELLRWRRSA